MQDDNQSNGHQITPDFYDEEYFMGVDHKPTKGGYFDYAEGSTHVNDANDLFQVFELNGKKVLDIGCCFGYQVKHLNMLGADAYGIDCSKFAVEKSYDQGRVQLVDVAKGLPMFPDDTFDFVYSLATLEHIHEEHIPGLLDEIKRVLKPTGETFHYPEVGTTAHAQADKSHVTIYPLSWWVDQLERVFPGGRQYEKEDAFLSQSTSAKKWNWHVLSYKNN